MATLYANIGRTYAGRRRSDPQIAAAIECALIGCHSVLNVGAGTGSYEPPSREVVAVEPSRIMIAQRPAGTTRVVQGRAEALPFRDQSFDGVLASLTVHHWKCLADGFSECARVARSKIVCFTIDMDACARFWLFDYFPELLHADRSIFPVIEQFREVFGSIEVRGVPIPADCRDGFLGAYWSRPAAYLDPPVRASISTFSKIGNIDAQLARLALDLDSGAWEEKYGDLTEFNTLDLGYRLIIADGVSMEAGGHDD